MCGCGCALLSMIIVHHETSVNDSWNPAEQSQNHAEEETGNPTGHKYCQRRQHHAEKISQRFHFRFVVFCLCSRTLSACPADGLRRRVRLSTLGAIFRLLPPAFTSS